MADINEIFEHILVILRNNDYMTTFFISLKVDVNAIEKMNTLFSKIGLRMGEILMLRAVKTPLE